MKFEKALINHTGKGYYLDKRTNTYKCVVSDKGKDGNVLNNDVNNLEWCTQADNILHAYKNNLVKHKLNNEQVLYIKKHYIPYDENFGARVLSQRFGISENMVSEIANGKRWKWLNEN